MLDGGKYGEYNSVSMMEISKIFVTEDDFVYGAALFDRVYWANRRINYTEKQSMTGRKIMLITPK